MSTPSESTQRYLIEHLRTVCIEQLDKRDSDLHDSSLHLTAWLLVGEIDITEPYPIYSSALQAWIELQDPEPPLGIYRVIKHNFYGSTFQELEIVETRKRNIVRVERPETALAPVPD